MKSIIIAAIAVMFLISPVFAATAAIEVSKSRVNPGDVVTITGKISDGAANASVFDFRGACVAPSRVVIFDTGRIQTNSDGTFSFSCTIPTLDNLTASGVPAVSARAVIPVVVGVAYSDSGEVRKSHETIFIINAAKLNEKLSKIEEHVQKTLSRLAAFELRVDSLIQRANQSGAARAVENLQRLKAHIEDVKNATSALLAKIQEAKQSGDIMPLERLLRNYEGSLKNVEKYTQLSREELSKTPERRGGLR